MMCDINNLGLAGGTNNITKVPAITQPIYNPNTLPMANVPTFIPPPTNTASGGSSFWKDLGGFLTDTVNTVAPYIGSNNQPQQGYTPGYTNQPNMSGQMNNAVQQPQYVAPRKTITQHVADNPLLSAGILVGTIGLGVYLFKK